ncbi:MAG: S8 family serine peptidase [Vicinamibacterales bacterium]
MTAPSTLRRATAAAALAGGWLLLTTLVDTQSTLGGGRAGRVVLNGREAVQGEVLVKYRNSTTLEARAAVEAESEGGQSEPVGNRGLRRLRSRRLATSDLLRTLRGHPDVEYAEPNWIVYGDNEPNDAQFVNLWGLLNTGQNFGGAGTPGADIGATTAWNVTTGSSHVVIGVIDSGIDYTHPDLAANVWSAPSSFTVSIGGQSITCAAGTHGFNAITRTCNPMDDHNHGTHAAGTIGAVGNNGTGVVGVNWTTKLMGLKFLGSNGSGSTADAINAIEFAIQAKAAFSATGGADVRILSNSWGGGGFSQALLDEINKANANDMLFVAAAGNNGSNNDATPNYPSNYTAANVVAVGATDNRDQLASFSNYGAVSVDLTAPGVSILSTIRNGGYTYYNGTSMATPHVAGAAGLMLAQCPMTTATLKTNLLAAVDLVPALGAVTATGGRLNVARGLSLCTPKVSSVTVSPSLVSPQAAGTAITWTATPTGGTAPYQYKWLITSGGAWSTVSNWSTSNTFVWTPGRPGSAYQIGVWVRSAPNTANTYEAGAVSAYVITGVSSVALTANKTAPQAPGTTVTWTAAPTGGTGPYQYKWLVTSGGAWSVASNWSSSSTYAWTPVGASNASHQVGVWVRSAGNSVDDYEAGAAVGFAVSGASGVALSANKTSPQYTGTTIRWTATPSGGTGSYEYKWLTTANGGAWSVASTWSTSNTFDWTPTGATNPNYQVGVWVRSAGNTADTYETGAVAPFSIVARVSQVTLSANKTAPQAPGTTITWTATPSGGATPYQYKWLITANGSSWSVVSAWSTSNTFAWTPTGASNSNYQVGVWVRSAGNAADTYEAGATAAFAIAGASQVTLAANKTAPQAPGTTVTWTATPTGGSGSYQYKWLVSANGSAWSVASTWSSSNTFAWTPTGASNSNYQVGVWVRSSGNTADTYEAGAVAGFAIAGASQVTLAANKTSPQAPGTAITFTATPTGGSGPYQYKWLVTANGSAWSVASTWSSSNTFTWTPVGANNSAYQVGVWVRSAGNTADTYETGAVMPFAVAGASQVTLAANKTAPQAASTCVTWTATPTGGSGPYQYKWLVTPNGSTWSVASTWSSSNTFTWTPASPSSAYQVGVWVRSAGNTADTYESGAAVPFPIQ